MTPIHIEGCIGWDITPADVRAQLQGAGDVELQVHSPGGFLHDALAIHNALLDHRRAGHRVSARVTGLAASAASYIVTAAEVVTAARNAVVMIHNPHVLALGDHRALAKSAQVLEAAAGLLADGYALRLGGAESAHALMDAETWWHGEEIVSAGFADALDPPLEADPASQSRSQAMAHGQFAVSAMLDGLKNHPEPLDRLAALLPSSKTPPAQSAAELAAAAESQRIQAVLSLHAPGHEALLRELAFDGHTTGPEAAAAVLAADNALRQRYLNSWDEAPAPVCAALPPDHGKPSAPPAANWESVLTKMTRGRHT